MQLQRATDCILFAVRGSLNYENYQILNNKKRGT